MQCSFLRPQNRVFMQYSLSVECDERLIVRHIYISREKRLSVSPCPSVRRFASIIAVLKVRIFFFLIFIPWGFKKICRESPHLVTIGQNVGHFTLRHKCPLL